MKRFFKQVLVAALILIIGVSLSTSAAFASTSATGVLGGVAEGATLGSILLPGIGTVVGGVVGGVLDLVGLGSILGLAGSVSSGNVKGIVNGLGGLGGSGGNGTNFGTKDISDVTQCSEECGSTDAVMITFDDVRGGTTNLVVDSSSHVYGKADSVDGISSGMAALGTYSSGGSCEIFSDEDEECETPDDGNPDGTVKIIGTSSGGSSASGIVSSVTSAL